METRKKSPESKTQHPHTTIWIIVLSIFVSSRKGFCRDRRRGLVDGCDVDDEDDDEEVEVVEMEEVEDCGVVGTPSGASSPSSASSQWSS